MVKVSIGVPVYNVDQWLRQCLDSIRQQSFQDFEVIMVDGGSTLSFGIRIGFCDVKGLGIF